MPYQHTQAAGLEQLIPPPVEHDREVFFASHPIAELPDVPRMIAEAQAKIKLLSRLDELVYVANIISGATPTERKHIISMLIDRGSEVDGSACELEDACCSIKLGAQNEI